MTKKEKIYAIETLEECIDKYIFDFKCKTVKYVEKSYQSIIIGMIEYAYLIEIIEKEKLEYYTKCVQTHKYVKE